MKLDPINCLLLIAAGFPLGFAACLWCLHRALREFIARKRGDVTVNGWQVAWFVCTPDGPSTVTFQRVPRNEPPPPAV